MTRSSVPGGPARRAISAAARVAYAAGVLTRLGATIACTRAVSRDRAAAAVATATATADAVERLGGAFVKVGQLLSMRPDVVGPVMATALTRLQDEVGPMTQAEALRTLRAAAVPWPADVEDALRAGPVASGGIACVYRWNSPRGPVALKILRPSADRDIRVDAMVIRGLARLVARLPGLGNVPLAEMAHDLTAAVIAQLDLGQERVTLSRLRSLLADNPDVVVPGVIAEYCSTSVLAMDFIEGLDRRGFAEASPDGREQGIAALVRAVYELIFIHGFVHVDLHQGNAYRLADGRIALLDVGFAHQLSEFSRDRFTRFFGGMVNGRGEGCADILLSTARPVACTDDQALARFRHQVSQLVRESAQQAAGQFSLPRFAVQLFQIQQRNGYYAEPEMMFPLLCLMALEGTVIAFAPEMDFQIEAAPYVMASLI